MTRSTWPVSPWVLTPPVPVMPGGGGGQQLPSYRGAGVFPGIWGGERQIQPVSPPQ